MLREVFRNPIYLEGFTNALRLAVGSTLLAFAIAAPLAWISERFEFPAKRVLSAFLLLPMMLPPFVGAIGFRQIFGQEGAVNALLHAVGWLGQNQVIDWLGAGREWGIVLLNALHLYPILYLNLVAALANVDPALLEAAENLGCSGLRRAWRVTIPLVMPGIFAGGTIVFIWAFTELGVPLMFDYYRVTPVQIFNGLSDIDSNPFTYALVAVTLDWFGIDLFCDASSGGQASAGHARTRWSLRAENHSRTASEACSAPLSFWRFALWLFYPSSASSSFRFQRIGIERFFLNRSPCSITFLRSAIILTVPAIQNSLVYASLVDRRGSYAGSCHRLFDHPDEDLWPLVARCAGDASSRRSRADPGVRISGLDPPRQFLRFFGSRRETR